MTNEAKVPFVYYNEPFEAPGQKEEPFVIACRLVGWIHNSGDNQDAAEWLLKHLLSMVRSYEEKVVAAGAVEQVVLVMQRHKECEPLIELACRFLFEIHWDAVLYVPYAEILQDADGIMVIMSLMQKFRNNGVIQEFGERALASLATNGSMRDSVIEQGSLTAIIGAMS